MTDVGGRKRGDLSFQSAHRQEAVVVVESILFSLHLSCFEKAMFTHPKLIHCNNKENDLMN